MLQRWKPIVLTVIKGGNVIHGSVRKRLDCISYLFVCLLTYRMIPSIPSNWREFRLVAGHVQPSLILTRLLEAPGTSGIN